MDDLIKRLRSPEFADVAEKYLMLEAADALKRMQWQPIETAPKDGTEIIGLLRPKVIRLVWWFQRSSDTFGFCDENGRDVTVTHWMSLPPTPKQKDK